MDERADTRAGTERQCRAAWGRGETWDCWGQMGLSKNAHGGGRPAGGQPGRHVHGRQDGACLRSPPPRERTASSPSSASVSERGLPSPLRPGQVLGLPEGTRPLKRHCGPGRCRNRPRGLQSCPGSFPRLTAGDREISHLTGLLRGFGGDGQARSADRHRVWTGTGRGQTRVGLGVRKAP